MNESTVNTTHTERLILGCCYVLYALLVTAPLGFLLSFYKMQHYKTMEKKGVTLDSEIKFIEEQHEWLSQTFVFTLLMLMAGLGTAVYFIGYIIVLFTIVWWFYRLFRGIFQFIDHKADPVFLKSI